MWENADQNNSEYGHFLCSERRLAFVYSRKLISVIDFWLGLLLVCYKMHEKMGFCLTSKIMYVVTEIYRQIPDETSEAYLAPYQTKKMESFAKIDYLRKMLHLRWLAGFWICLLTSHSLIFYVFLFYSVKR